MSSPVSIAAPAPDWTRTALGDCAAWPNCLRLTIDILLNSPLPMVLQWGEQQIMVYNDAYVELMGSPSLRAPGATVPSLPPAVWTWHPDVLAHARAGHSASYRGQDLPVWQGDACVQKPLDLYYTPVRDDDQVVRGVLCTACPAQAQARSAGHATRALNLLVVEDNADARYLVCETLRALGHEVEAAASAEEALPQLTNHQFDVLFTDVSLPGMSGVDLARQARREQPALEVLFASGYGDELTRHLEFSARALQKPYDLDVLQDALVQISRKVQAKAV
ncbi:histidine kinase [Duganella sp. Leaf126]|uniref:response regulator n=1 Tax=Duganella sp. Leaf126 TaxID=1736266 RepID=UPI0006FC4AAB|nr:response regulator [Duganella sp. Leaf126]KQQ36200.1 histidine kinase [Duganella sp. Leaf126]